MNLSALLDEDQRLVILRALASDNGFEHNESILHSILTEFGHKVGRDKVRTLISWLKEQGLVTVRTVGSTMIARITQAGLDAANGATSIPGVKRPSPGMG